MGNIYTSGQYEKLNPDWHLNDSYWKAQKIFASLNQLNVIPGKMLDFGCGLGGVSYELTKMFKSKVNTVGVDLSSDLLSKANSIHGDLVEFKNISNTDEITDYYDVVLLIDVFEHIPDYYNILKNVKHLGEFKVFHVPIDLNIPNILFRRFSKLNKELGHLHYFNEETIKITLNNIGYEILYFSYTNSSIDFAKSIKEKLMRIPRLLLSFISPRLASDVFGGFSLLIVCK